MIESKSVEGGPWRLTPASAIRLALTTIIVVGYYSLREPLKHVGLEPSTVAVLNVSATIALLIFVWRKQLLADPRFHAPVLITSILAIGDASYGILETHHVPWLAARTGGRITSYSPTFVCIFCTIACELVMARFYYGKWPHLASAYISGISAGILIKSPALWPFLLGGTIAITSKYVLRIGDRHLWNPTNFGITMLLLLAPDDVASLTVQAGNTVWAVLIIWVLGGLIMVRLGRFHIPLAFVATFVPLAFLRAAVTGHSWVAEIAWITFPMFQLFIFFMITDPKTTPRARWAQVLVAVLVAVMDTVLRLAMKDVHSLYHALFIVGPIANVVEMWHDRRMKARKAEVAAAAVPVTPALVVARG